MAGATDLIMIGGMLLLGYVVITNMGSITSAFPNFTNRIILDREYSDDYEDYSDYIECNDDGSECRYCEDAPDPEDCRDTKELCGKAIKTKGDSERRVERRAYEKWKDRYDKIIERCRMTGSRSGGPSRTITTTTKQQQASSVIPNSGLPSDIKRFPGVAGKNALEKIKNYYGSGHVTLYKHSHNPLNIPRAFLVNKQSKMNLHLNYV